MLYIPHPDKRCYKCCRFKPASEFPKNRSKRDGLADECHVCNRKHVRKWCNEHPEETAEGKKRYAANNPDKRKESTDKYTANNREVIEFRRRESYSIDPTPYRVRGHNYRSKGRALTSTFTEANWCSALEYFHGVCAYCGNPPRLWDAHRVLHQEHFIPVDAGGEYTRNNILPACIRCNSSKRNKDATIWLTKCLGKRKANQVLKRIQEYFEWIKTQT